MLQNNYQILVRDLKVFHKVLKVRFLRDYFKFNILFVGRGPKRRFSQKSITYFRR